MKIISTLNLISDLTGRIYETPAFLKEQDNEVVIVCMSICSAIICDEAMCEKVCDQICGNICDKICEKIDTVASIRNETADICDLDAPKA